MPLHAIRKNLLPATLRRHADAFTDLRDVQQLGALLRMPVHQVQLLALAPRYKTFTVPKSSGGRRLIEDPAPPLKKLLRWLNHYLQAHYVRLRPECVHGFCISPRHQEDRNVLSNARRHLGHPHLLNVDLKDFFHQVSAGRVRGLLQRHFPRFAAALTDLLTRLLTYKGRLPMGAPTSPALSNYASLGMDAELEAIARNSGLTYTRFADDLSFSATDPIGIPLEQMLRGAIRHHGFVVNPDKVRRYGPGEDRIVTGLHLRDGRVQLPDGYLPQLRTEIARLHTVMAVDGRYRTGMSDRKLKLLQQEIRGKMNFAGLVLGHASAEMVAQGEAYEAALDARAAWESLTWLEIPYGLGEE